MFSNLLHKQWPLRAKNRLEGASAFLRSSRWPRRVAWAVGVWWLVWALAYAVVPLVLKSQLARIGAEKLGRPVTVGAVDFKPWTLELTVHDLVVGGALPQSAPQLKIRRLYIDAELESLLRLAPVADAIVVDDPAVSLAYLGGGRYDIDDILARLQTPNAKPSGDVPLFALYNLELRGGRVDFVDQSVHKTHVLRDLHVAVPFLSSLPSQRDIKIAPHLAFTLNGSRFDSAAVGTPFARTRQTDATITLRDLDLAPYLAYWPASLPVRLQSAVLQADVTLAFEQTPASVVKISGTVTADKVRLLDAQTPTAERRPVDAEMSKTTTQAAPVSGHELLAFDRLEVRMEDVRPLQQQVKLSAVTLTAPTLFITRDRAGRLNLLPPETPNATKTIAASTRPASAAGQNDSKIPLQAALNPASAPASASAPAVAVAGAAVMPWRVQVAQLALNGGTLNWRDDTLASPAQIRLAGLALQASALAYPFTASAPLKFKGSLGLADTSAKPVKAAAKAAPGAASDAAARVTFEGSATDQAAQLTATVADWPLNMAAHYVGQFLHPALNGQLDARLDVNWQAATADQPQALRITAPELALSGVQLAQGKTALAFVKRVTLTQADIDVPGQTFKAASLQLSQPKARVERTSDGRWMYERWLVGHEAAAASPAVKSTGKLGAKTGAAAPKTNTPAWAVAIDEVLLDGGSMSFSDQSGAKPVAFEVTAAKARLGALVLDERPESRAQAARLMPLSASLRLATGRFAPGSLDFKGTLGMTPLQAKGQVLMTRLPVQAFEPYFAGALNVELLRADASFKGSVAYRQMPAGPQADVAGDVTLEEFKANTLAPGEELLAWKTLNMRGLTVALTPAKATRVDVKETVLSDFFARVIILPDGRINLQDLMKPASPATPAARSAPETIATDARQASANAPKDLKAAAVAAADASPPPIINFGPVSLVNGKVQFSDRFVKPNYSADLSELTGKLSAFSSVAPRAPDGSPAAPAMADLELRGKAEGTASLEITGKLNPLAKPLALDITGKVRDLELPPLSPYAIKYAGYGIERGKLSMDVNYVVLPNGQLTARNKLVLNQLSFGDKAEGSTASLPVKLAVALLADRHGVIDLDLPISGSLNDPQFSLGPVIVKVILNVIVKAITAPFSLLAHALGGGEELSVVNFAPGSAQLAPDAKVSLDKVAQALLDRPALRLTVVGASSLPLERDGFQREQLNQRVRVEKRRQQIKQGVDANALQTETQAISPADYPALLKEVYKHADLPKPRNLLGLAKELPVDEMEKLLLASLPVSDEALHALAVQRGVAVRDYLASKGLPTERLFLGAVKAVPPETKWTPRAELNLAMP